MSEDLKERLRVLNLILSDNLTHREATEKDISNIEKLFSNVSESSQFFAPTPMKSLIKRSLKAYVTEDEAKNIVSFISFQNYPTIPALDKNCWIHWIHYHYG
ncbi:CFAP61 family protein [Megaselia abdita]